MTQHIQSLALQALGACPKWDRAVLTYLHASTIAQAQSAWGPHAAALEAVEEQRGRPRCRHGRGWRAHRELADEITARTCEIEEKAVREIWQPLWRASRELVATDAPTLAAALMKAEVIQKEDVANDSEFPGDCMQILQADFDRLAKAERSALHADQ